MVDQLIRQLQNEIYTERREAARGLAEVGPGERDQAVQALQDRLAVEDAIAVINAIVEALLQLGVPEPVVCDLLVRRMSDRDFGVRFATAKGLAQLQDPVIRQKAIEVLKRQLAVEDADGVISAIVEALLQLGAPEPAVYDILLRRISDENGVVRYGTFRGLAQLQDPVIWQKAIEVLKRHLTVEDDRLVIDVIVEALHDRGIKVEEISRILVHNPHLPELILDHFHNNLFLGRWGSRGVAHQVLDYTLHRGWWRLIPADVRRHLDLSWPGHGGWDHCFRWHRLQEPEVKQFIDAFQRIWSLRWHFARSDFEALMSLRVTQNVVYEEQHVLRFRFLDAYATDHQGRPIRECMREFQNNWDGLLETEDAFDRMRDEIADLRRTQDKILAEAQRQQEERPPEPEDRLPQDLQSMGRLRDLESELQTCRQRLEEATDRLLPHLNERGVRFRVVEIEGVLGEYNFYERKITLYPPMIELAAKNLASDIGRPPADVYVDLYTITEMHETAHATAHLGLDATDRFWERPQEASRELHETVAQFYTRALIERLNDPRLREVFLRLNERQPERYTFWRYIAGIPLERVRLWLCLQREGQWQDDILTSVRDIAQVINRLRPLIDAEMPEVQRQAFYESLTDISQRMERATKLTELCEAAGALIAVCEAQPLLGDLVQAAIGRRGERGLLMAASLCKYGKPISGPTLRLSMDEIESSGVMSATVSQAVADICNWLFDIPNGIGRGDL